MRVLQNIYAQLPTDERERSRLLLRLMEDYYNQKNPESELAKLKVRVKALERRFGEKWEGLERSRLLVFKPDFNLSRGDFIPCFG